MSRTARRVVLVTVDGVTTHYRPGRHADASPLDARRVPVVTIDKVPTRFRAGRHSDFTDHVDTLCVRLAPMGVRARAVAAER